MRKLITTIILLCSSFILIFIYWPEFRTEFRTTEDKLEGLLQLNGFWVDSIRCESLDDWGSDCTRECCSGWSHADTEYGIKALFLSKDLTSDDKSFFLGSSKLKECLESQNINNLENSYTSAIKSIERVAIDRGVVKLSSGRDVETNKYTFFINFGCALD